MRGQWIPFDADALSQFLGHPLILAEGQQCKYNQRKREVSSFDEENIAQLLYIPGQDFAQTTAGRRVPRILLGKPLKVFKSLPKSQETHPPWKMQP